MLQHVGCANGSPCEPGEQSRMNVEADVGMRNRMTLWFSIINSP